MSSSLAWIFCTAWICFSRVGFGRTTARRISSESRKNSRSFFAFSFQKKISHEVSLGGKSNPSFLRKLINHRMYTVVDYSRGLATVFFYRTSNPLTVSDGPWSRVLITPTPLSLVPAFLGFLSQICRFSTAAARRMILRNASNPFSLSLSCFP